MVLQNVPFIVAIIGVSVGVIVYEMFIKKWGQHSYHSSGNSEFRNRRNEYRRRHSYGYPHYHQPNVTPTVIVTPDNRDNDKQDDNNVNDAYGEDNNANDAYGDDNNANDAYNNENAITYDNESGNDAYDDKNCNNAYEDQSSNDAYHDENVGLRRRNLEMSDTCSVCTQSLESSFSTQLSVCLFCAQQFHNRCVHPVLIERALCPRCFYNTY